MIVERGIADTGIGYMGGGKPILFKPQDADVGWLKEETQDDLLEEVQGDHAAPRDNVVFQAGYITQSKGRERVLIIRENGVKMPADVGGSIYLPLKDRKDISSIEMQLLSFGEKRL